MVLIPQSIIQELMKILTWTDFQNAVAKIANHYNGRAFNGVYGFPRGGLPLAVTLSHYLDLPLLSELEEDCLIVDDIYETGKTLEPTRDLAGCSHAVWLTKAKGPIWYFAAEDAVPSEWIVFPWEDPSQALKDQEEYYATH